MKIVTFLLLISSLFVFSACTPSLGVGVPVGNHGAVGVDTDGDVSVGVGL